MADDEQETRQAPHQQMDAAERIYRDGYYDDGAGTVFSVPDVVGCCPSPDDPEKTRIVLEGGTWMELDENPIEMAYLVRVWGRARREAADVFSSDEARAELVEDVVERAVDRIEAGFDEAIAEAAEARGETPAADDDGGES